MRLRAAIIVAICLCIASPILIARWAGPGQVEIQNRELTDEERTKVVEYNDSASIACAIFWITDLAAIVALLVLFCNLNSLQNDVSSPLFRYWRR
jgi:hypothetical protein